MLGEEYHLFQLLQYTVYDVRLSPMYFFIFISKIKKNFIIEMRYILMYFSKIVITKYRVKNREMLFFYL